MTKINRKEYEILKGLDDKWKWIARDKKGELWAYRCKPAKENKFWREGILMGLSNGILQFIQWEDEEPYNIAELIEGCEINRVDEMLEKMNIPTSVIEDVSESEETLFEEEDIK